MENKDTVGAISGYYDDKLSIAEVSESFLNNLGFRYDEFMQVTGGSFRKIFCGDNQTFLEPERFPLIKGVGEGQMLTKEGVALYVRMEKQDTQDESGRRMWVITAEIDQIQQSLKIVNNVIQSGMWYIDCDEKARCMKYSGVTNSERCLDIMMFWIFQIHSSHGRIFFIRRIKKEALIF